MVNQALGLLLQICLQSVMLSWLNLGLQPIYGACAVVVIVGVIFGLVIAQPWWGLHPGEERATG